MKTAIWGVDDPLCRGDNQESVRLPDPAAAESIVRHVLYLDGPGRSTPYLSTTEDEEIARTVFGGKAGRVWFTTVARAQSAELRYISNAELLDLLRGKGKGDALWPRASEVMQARAFAEQWAEHLVDFRSQKGKAPDALRSLVASVFTKERP